MNKTETIPRNEEIWKDIRGYERYYQISNYARIKNKERVYYSGRYYLIKTTRPETILKLKKDKDGYYCINLCKDGIVKLHKIHRLIAEAFIPNPENKPCINHKNGIKTDNRVENLEWCTPKENSNHAVETGLLNFKGSKHPLAILNEEKVSIIKALLFSGERPCLLARIFNVNCSIIKQIKYNKTWNHVKIEGDI